MRRAAVAAVLLVAVACSGGDGLTKQQFIRRGDAICARVARAGRMLDGADPAAAVDRVVSQTSKARAAFATLDPPEDGRSVKRAILSYLDDAVVEGRKARAALDRQDTAAAQRAIPAAGVSALAATKAAEDYGFQECSVSLTG